MHYMHISTLHIKDTTYKHTKYFIDYSKCLKFLSL